jgi:hypothetical protein
MKGSASHFCANVCLDFCFVGSQVEARRAVNPVSVEQRHGGLVELGADCDKFLRQGSTFEKTESRAGVKFDVQVLSTRYSVLSQSLP